MRVEKEVTEWKEVDAKKCHFCGYVSLDDTDIPLHVITIPSAGHETRWACAFCLENEPEPRYPNGVRPVED